MTSEEIKRAREWARQQRKTVIFEPPDRRPDEPDATPDQLAHIRLLVASIDEAQLNGLGRWQAIALIDAITKEQDWFALECAADYLAKPAPKKPLRSLDSVWDCFCALAAALVTAAIAWLIWHFSP